MRTVVRGRRPPSGEEEEEAEAEERDKYRRRGTLFVDQMGFRC